MENLADRQAADAVRSRIDWTYALRLELTDPGFDHSVLTEFRTRLLRGEAEQRLLDRMLDRLRQAGPFKAGTQRTDSTAVLANIRELTRLERVGETLRAALNEMASSTRNGSARPRRRSGISSTITGSKNRGSRKAQRPGRNGQDSSASMVCSSSEPSTSVLLQDRLQVESRLDYVVSFSRQYS